jgi:hypothetical protein
MSNQNSIRRALGRITLTILAAAPAVLVVCCLPPSLPRRPEGEGVRHAAYDQRSIVRVGGEITSLEQVQAEGESIAGISLAVDVDRKPLVVRLGPSSYLARHSVILRLGDHVEVTGKLGESDGSSVFVADAVSLRASTLRLRDEAGRPLWRAVDDAGFGSQ